MVASPLRDDAVLQRGIAAWLRTDAITLERPTVGFSNETVLVTAMRGAGIERIVLRLPPVVATFPDPPGQWLLAQREVHRTLHAAGVAVPHPVEVVTDETWLGAPFLAMPWCAGRAAGEAPGLDPWITESPLPQQRLLHEAWADLLGALHTAPFDHDALTAVGLRAGLASEVGYWRNYVEWAADGEPPAVLRDALAWCASTMPPSATGAGDALLWGDARLGNVLFADDRTVTCALDWELASIGPAEMDLAWYLVLDAITTKVTRAPVEGFLTRDELLARWSRRSGRTVTDFGWHECFALARSIAINDRQARIAAQLQLDYPGVAGDANPMLGVLTRRIERTGH